MRKIDTVLTSLLLTALISSVVTVSVRGESINKDMTRWVNYSFKGHDVYYETDVVAYQEGSTATLVASIENDIGTAINVSVVGISFDWQKPEDGWYNSTQASKEKTVVLEPGETLYFTVNFTVPSIEVAHAVLHDYVVYVEYADPDGSLRRWNATRTYFDPDLPYFAVYSEDQAQSKQMDQTIAGIEAPTWDTIKAKLLWQRAMNESTIADYYYALGDFTQAIAHYGKALSLIDEAFAYEEIQGAALEDAEIENLETQVKLAEAWANFANGLSNMWTLIGVALVLFAVGYIIRGLTELRRKPSPL